jgi:hypothetical protein
MKKALFNKATAMVSDIGRTPFDVPESLEWVDVPDECNDSWRCISGEGEDFAGVRAPTRVDGMGNDDINIMRALGYGKVGMQLDMLFHHTQNGGVVGDADCPWTKHVETVKTSFPKDDPIQFEKNCKEFHAQMEAKTCPDQTTEELNPNAYSVEDLTDVESTMTVDTDLLV